MKTYNKIFAQKNKLQIGVDQDGQIFLRFNGGSNINDLVLGTDDALRGLHSVLTKYIEESEPVNRGLLH